MIMSGPSGNDGRMRLQRGTRGHNRQWLTHRCVCSTLLRATMDATSCSPTAACGLLDAVDCSLNILLRFLNLPVVTVGF